MGREYFCTILVPCGVAGVVDGALRNKKASTRLAFSNCLILEN
jgi:hypothetical protein